MTDYSVFASPEFDANEYANALLAGEQYPPFQASKSKSSATRTSSLEPAKEDISVAISQLNVGIDDVSKQIKSVVTSHHEDLLQHASSVNDLSGSFGSVKHGLDDLDASLEKLRLKIRVPFEQLQSHVTRLQRLQSASDILRRTSRFVILARRLETQMSELATYERDGVHGSKLDGAKTIVNFGLDTPKTDSVTTLDNEGEKERAIAKAALVIAELAALIDGSSEAPSQPPGVTSTTVISPENGDSDLGANVPLRSIDVVAAYIPFIEEARAKVTSEMESMVLKGLTTLDQSMLASSLQTAYNLRVLPRLVHSLLSDLSDAVEERMRNTFDLSLISKDVASKEATTTAQGVSYRSRVRTEPTSTTAPQWAAALWNRLEVLIEEMAGCCIKVYTLEKVLKLKKDPVTQVAFLDEAMKLLENKPSSTFWTSLSRSLERYARDNARGSTFLQQTLSSGYLKLLRLFHEFFAKIAVHTDTVYTDTHQSPETILILRSLSNFESVYLARSSNRLNEAVAQAFSGGVRNPPGSNEGINIARTMANELDAARFDPFLAIAIAKNVASSVDGMIGRAESVIIRDRSATTLLGPAATPAQTINGQIVTCLFHCWSRLEKLGDEHTESVSNTIKPSIQKIEKTYNGVVEPLIVAIRRELSAIIARVHRVDFGGTSSMIDPTVMGAGPSLYMKDLVEKLNFIRAEIFSKYHVGETGRTWVISIVRYAIRTFVLHVSIAKPLSESGKLQLTSDMTEFEFALSAFLIENPASKRGGNLEVVGEEYRALRAMRPLLFLDTPLLSSSKHTIGLPPLIVLHHILVRSPIPLPHTLHGWQEAEYVRWVNEHHEEEALTLVESGLSHWEKTQEAKGSHSMEDQEYVDLARTVLGHARGNSS